MPHKKEKQWNVYICDISTAIFYVILLVFYVCLCWFLSSQACFDVSVSVVHSNFIVIFVMFFVLFICLWKFLSKRNFLKFCVSTASFQDIGSVCARSLCWFYLLYLCEIVCRFPTNSSNFHEHRRCELKCDSICGFAAACGGQEEFFQLFLCGCSQLRVMFSWNQSEVLSEKSTSVTQEV